MPDNPSFGSQSYNFIWEDWSSQYQAPSYPELYPFTGQNLMPTYSYTTNQSTAQSEAADQIMWMNEQAAHQQAAMHPTQPTPWELHPANPANPANHQGIHAPAVHLGTPVGTPFVNYGQPMRKHSHGSRPKELVRPSSNFFKDGQNSKS